MLVLPLVGRFKWWGVLVAFIFGIAIGYIDVIGQFLSLSRTFVFFPIFLLGFCLQREHFNKIRNQVRWKWVGVILLLTILTAFYFVFPKEGIQWLFGSYSFESMGVSGWEAGAIRLIQYGLTIAATIGFLALVPNQPFKLTVIGARTMYVYLLHGFVIQTVKAFIPHKQLDLLSSNLLLLFVASIGICLFFGHQGTKRLTRPIILN
ncbi:MULTISPECIES: acyltransferase family protein [Halobacillus]|uniref:acyltransferase family protein n=1 Tax=Halobacillus TaxID=45667 RepID=UPI0009A856C9|nr:MULTISPECIES: acyltransferase family protein [Halobacillus]